MGPLSYEELFRHIVGSVTRLYRSCSIRDTGMMIIEEKEEEETGKGDRGRSESNQKKENREKRSKRYAGGRRGKGGKGAPRGQRERCARKVIRRNGAKESVLGCTVTIDEMRENERARVGIKWGGLLISLATHPRSVAQDPRVLPRLIQHYEYFLLVVGVSLSDAAERASGA